MVTAHFLVCIRSARNWESRCRDIDTSGGSSETEVSELSVTASWRRTPPRSE
jgi:hypothetical protein